MQTHENNKIIPCLFSIETTVLLIRILTFNPPPKKKKPEQFFFRDCLWLVGGVGGGCDRVATEISKTDPECFP